MRKLPVVPLCRRPAALLNTPNQQHPSARPVPTRGAYRDRHGRWVRDAMDASDAVDESAALRTAKLCGPDAPMLASSLRVNNPQATVAKEPGHRGERRISRRTIAQGRPECFGEPVVTTLVRFFCCVRGCGCIEHPAFPAPSLFLGERSCKARAHRAARRRRRVWNRLGCLKIRSVTIRCVRARRTSNCHHP